MKKKLCFFLYLLSLFSITLNAAADDDDDDLKNNTATQSSAALHNQGSIVLDSATQAASGLKTLKLKANTYRTELLSYGMAISIEPLLAIQNQYVTALAQQSSAQAKAQFSQNNLNRLSYLHHEQIISTHALQDQQASLQADKAALTSSVYLSQQIINNARLVWGEVITDWLIKPAAVFTDLLQQRRTLLKITFPPTTSTMKPLPTIFVAGNGQREQAVMAQFISAVPQADSFSQGQQYFYHLPTQQIKAGMRISAWIPTQQQSQTGVIIPDSAVCWHLGQALVFVKMTAQQFTSRTLSAYHKIAGGYFVHSGLKAGEEIVSTGAQMLLSQEFKGQIPSEDDD
jgi:hypothetical protein